jgi:putative transposase
MGLARRQYVQEGQEGVYHCFSRCVRRAFLCGLDALTGRDFSHRKALLVGRLRDLAGIFAIEVCAYAVLATHYHLILRIRPDIVAGWSDREVARNWLTLFPRRRDGRGNPMPPEERDICALADQPERIAELRRRLSSLSWFMGRLNEYMARAANKEDRVRGRFWESRFRCQVLLDEAAVAACMVYVDLNPIRAGVAGTPEGSDFTSIQERIRAWHGERVATGAVAGDFALEMESGPSGGDRRELESAGEMVVPISGGGLAQRESADGAVLSACWLCPIESDSGRRGILQMTAGEYIDLVDKSGRMVCSDKRGAIDADLGPILLRVGANPEAWRETISDFGSRFGLAAGLVSSLRRYSDQLGRCWLKGVATARAAFASALPQLAGLPVS